MFCAASVQGAQVGVQKIFLLSRFSSSRNTCILEHTGSSSAFLVSQGPFISLTMNAEQLLRVYLSLMKIINCTHLACFWPLSYDYTKAVHLQEPELYPPLFLLFSTYAYLQMCSHVYLQVPCTDKTISTQQIHDLQAFCNLKR